MLRALLERDIVPDVIVGCSAGRVQRRDHRRPRRASAASSGWRRRGSRCAATRCSPGGRLSRAWNLLTRDDHLFSNQGLRDIFQRGDTARHLRGARDPAAGGGRRPRHRRRGRVRPGPAPARAARQRRAARASSRPIRHDGRTLVDGAVVDTVPLWHALAGPVDRIYVMNVAGDLMRPPAALPDRRRRPRLRHQPQAALRPRAAQRARDASRCVVLPAPVDDRELFDFSGGRRAHGRRPRPRRRRRSTTPSRPSAARRQLRRPWWRRDAEVG